MITYIAYIILPNLLTYLLTYFEQFDSYFQGVYYFMTHLDSLPKVYRACQTLTQQTSYVTTP